MAEYMEAEVTDYDVWHIEHETIATYDKNKAEKEIAEYEKMFGKVPEQVKENIRKRYRYVGKDKE